MLGSGSFLNMCSLSGSSSLETFHSRPRNTRALKMNLRLLELYSLVVASMLFKGAKKSRAKS